MTRRVAGLCPRLFSVWMAGVVRWRYALLAVAVALTALSVFACTRYLGISTNTVDMISPEVPFRQHARAFNAAFPQLDNLILAVVDGATPEDADALADALAERARRSAHVREAEVPGGGFLRSHALLYLSPAEVDRLIDRLAEAEPMLATLAGSPTLDGLAEVLTLAAGQGADNVAGLERLLDEMAETAAALRDGRGRALSWQSLLVPPDMEGMTRTRRIVVIRPELDFTRLKPAAAAIAEVRSAAAALEARPSAEGRIRLTGEAVIEHEELESVEAGGSLAALLSLVAVSAIMLSGLRAPRLVAASLITLLAGLVWTAGLAAVVVGQLNLISVAFAVLFVGLGIDFCIHFASRYREERQVGAAAAVQGAGTGVGCASLLSALCAAVGFLSFLPTTYRGLAELGLISGLGMFVAVLASVTLLPALIAIWKPRHGMVEAPELVGRELNLVQRHARKVLVIAAAAAVAGGLVATQVAFDFNPMNLRDPKAASIVTFDDLARDIETSPYAVNVLAPDLEQAESIAGRFRAAGGFGSVRTLASFVPADQEAKLGMLEDAAFFLAPILMEPAGHAALSPKARTDAFVRLRDAVSALSRGEGEVSTAAAALNGRLAELGPHVDVAALAGLWTRYLPDTLAFLRDALAAGPVALADLPEALRAKWVGTGGQFRVEVRPPEAISENGAIRRFAERAEAVDAAATGAPIVIHEAARAVVAAFQEATLYALLGILLLLAATLRRIGDVVVTAVPLVLASVLTLATAALLGIPLNFANVIVLPLLLGLGVSSSIHLVLRAREVARIDRVFATSTPRAVLLSVLTTLASFGTLVVSEHRGMSSMGALLSIAIAYTLIAILVVLPCLLAELRRRESGRGAPRRVS